MAAGGGGPRNVRPPHHQPIFVRRCLLSARSLPLYPTQSGHSILLEELPTLTHTKTENRFVAKCDSVGGYFLGGENPT